MMHRIALALSVLLLLAGCATNVPQTIRSAPPGNPPLASVQEAFERYQGQPVRWGGEIVEVRNFERGSELLVLARPLNSWGEPIPNSRGLGRFIALFDTFADPAEYAAGRSLTIHGRLQRLERRMIDEYPYDYPIITVEDQHLWPKATPGDRDPYWTWGLHDNWFHRDQVIIIREPTTK